MQLWQYCAFIAGLALLYVGSEACALAATRLMERTLLSARSIYWLYRVRVRPDINGLPACRARPSVSI